MLQSQYQGNANQIRTNVTPGCKYKSHRVDIDTSEYSNSTINVQNKFNHLIEQIRTRAFVQVTQRIEID